MAELAAFAVFALNPPVIFDILLRFSLGACALEGSKDGKSTWLKTVQRRCDNENFTAQTGDAVYRGRSLRGCDVSNGGGQQPRKLPVPLRLLERGE
jgi:hypothetical protein